MAKLSCGIVGLPNVGKSTLFNALTLAESAESANYPFCTIDPNVGIVDVIDERLDILSKMSKSKKIVHAVTEFVDIAGLVEGASKGEGLGNKFLANIRETNAIVHVVRCFEDENITHVSGGIDPIHDIEVINTELVLADLQMAENILVKLKKQARTDKEAAAAAALIERLMAHLNKGKPVRAFELTDDERQLLKPYQFLTAKKVLYAANVSEEDLPSMENEYVAKVREYAAKEGSEVVPICAKLEQEVGQFEPDEAKEFLASLGLEESGLQRLVNASFKLLGLITFITTGEIETRAWTIREGTEAARAAGEIHGDIEKGFIRAEVVTFNDMVEYKGRNGAKEKGKLRSEGRDYVVQDGDVILFLHN